MRYAHVPVKEAVISETGSAGFRGVTAPIDPHIEIPEEVRNRWFESRKNWRW
jgi:hypothetical protein